jgi:hypothetical protein
MTRDRFTALVVLATAAAMACARQSFGEVTTVADVALDSLPPTKGPQCPGSQAGSANGVYPGFGMAYTTVADSTGNFLEAALIVRAPAVWLARPVSGMRPPSARLYTGVLCKSAGGSVIGPLQFYYAVGSGVVWMDTMPVAMGLANVLLVDVGRDGIPRVLGTAHVRPRLTGPRSHFGGDRQAEGQAAHDAVWKVLRTSPTVLRFMDP